MENNKPDEQQVSEFREKRKNRKNLANKILKILKGQTYTECREVLQVTLTELKITQNNEVYLLDNK